MHDRLYIDDTRQRVRGGHPWIYDDQVLRPNPALECFPSATSLTGLWPSGS